MTHETDTLDQLDDSEAPTVETLGSRGRLWFSGGVPTFKPWTGRTEMELSKLLHKSASKLEGGRVARKISLTLANMIVEIDGQEFHRETTAGRFEEVMPLTEREAFIRNMWETDVLTAFFLYRNAARGDSTCKLPLLSPYDPEGKRTVMWIADLNDLPFEGSPSIEASQVVHEFSRPVPMRGKMVERVILGPHRWAVSEDLRFESKPYEAQLRLLAGSIHGAHGFNPNTQFVMEDLYDIPGTELAGMGRALKHSGLDLSIEAYDDVADKTFQSTVPWLHPDFLV